MKKILRIVVSCILFSVMQNASATVNIAGTRVIYDGAKKEVSLSVRNPDSTPYLMQTIVENLDNNPQKPPFIITPPLYRLNGGKENLMRIILAGNLPQDKESMYWLRVKAIPSAPKSKNTLQIAVATSVKLIYRPETLKNIDVEKESNKLVWHISGNNLEVKNPSSCFINFNEVMVSGKKLSNVSYVAPGSTATFALPDGVNAGNIEFSVISDFGAIGKLHSVSA